MSGEKLLPHVHDKTVPGGVRNPFPNEILKLLYREEQVWKF